MRKTNIKTKEQARNKAINWQNWVSNISISYFELIEWENYFLKLATRFNLVDEFKENGIS